MDSAAIATIVATVISIIVSTFVSTLLQNRKTIKEEMARLRQDIKDLLKISIEYPYLEDNTFCNSWSSANKNDEKVQRYDNYCCIVFNLISQIYKLFEGDESKIDDFFATKEMIVRHKKWWKSPSGFLENLNGYSSDFRSYVESKL